ncbi:hypothetical protein [Protaetiibacter mangrovi]|uniref:Lipoprotein n=1 Tax=Protaetiibacter mangrovi TaxID=2970926 RepID=A0ABT1ZF33_9MICO|nr:hypothetical protein [Protaetiibacter mangrovi]MCS0499321.1 hypothetical protein [Protaetiibacter mangrovi]TPX02308.1 hypothetical protein FJ656_23050 [Schumannella luteola]
MTTTPSSRILAAIAASTLVLGALTGCSLPSIPGLPGFGGAGDAVVDSELVGTTWSGTDSDGDSWVLELQEDGTVGLTYDGSSYDDSTDTWAQVGSTVTFHIGFDDGDIDMIGEYAGVDSPMEASGTYPGGSFTVTLVQG